MTDMEDLNIEWRLFCQHITQQLSSAGELDLVGTARSIEYNEL